MIWAFFGWDLLEFGVTSAITAASWFSAYLKYKKQ